MKKVLLTLIVSLAFCGSIFAQQYESHWLNDYYGGDYEDHGDLVAAIMIDGVVVTLDYESWDALEVAPFVGDECRGNIFNFLFDGVTVFEDPYPILNGMPINYNSDSLDFGQPVSFKMYDHLNDILYEGCTAYYLGEPITIHTGEDHLEGFFDNEHPVMLNFTIVGSSTQTLALSEGWNWVSFNVEVTLAEVQSALQEAYGSSTVRIKSKNSVSTWNGTRWRGNIVWDLANMYRIEAPSSSEITFEGEPVDPADHPVTISNGITWIAYPLTDTKTVANVFAGFAVSGDKVKSKASLSSFNGSTWRPQMNLVPGQGYIYNSSVAGDRVFTFPSAK